MSANDEQATPLEEFVRQTIEAARASLPEGFRFEGPIEFKMSVVSKREGRGGAKLYVVDVGGKYQAEEIKEITFKVTNAEDPQAHIRAAEKKLIERMNLG